MEKTKKIPVIICVGEHGAARGCQVHDLSVWRERWRERWREIAREHGVTVGAEDVARLIEEALLGPEWLPSEEGGEHG